MNSFGQELYYMHIQMADVPLLTLDGLSNQKADRIKPVVDILNSPLIDKENLKKYLRLGILDDAHLVREYAWKVILEYLPENRQKWNETISKQEGYYNDYLQTFLPQQSSPIDQAQYERDNILWRQIEKDTYRTQPAMPYFKQKVKPFSCPFQPLHQQQKQGEPVAYRYNYMTRILFIFAKLNHLVEYVQGMNEILAPIFYVVNRSSQLIQEAACFFMFANVMGDIIYFHIKNHENKESQFHERMGKIGNMLIIVDPEIHFRLEQLQIDPFFYLFRWITILFAQEFPMEQTIRIWEMIFSYKDRKAFVNAFSVALIVSIREQINAGSFVEVLQHLKSISNHLSLEDVIVKAREYCECNQDWWKSPPEESDIAEEQMQETESENKWNYGFFKFFS